MTNLKFVENGHDKIIKMKNFGVSYLHKLLKRRSFKIVFIFVSGLKYSSSLIIIL